MTLNCLAVLKMPKGIEAKTFPDVRTHASAATSSTKSNTQPLSVVGADSHSDYIATSSELSSRTLPCVSCEGFIKRHNGDHPAAPHREEFDALMSTCFSRLSPRAQELAQLKVIQMLKEVPNSAAAMTRFLSHVDLSRYDHSIHAAAKVRDLSSDVASNLSNEELSVLEMAALLHDLGHRLGSHALDRVFAAHPAAPDIQAYGWGREFHEFHTAKMVATYPELIAALGPLHANVLAVLCHSDNRRNCKNENGEGSAKLSESFEKDFGKFEPTLSEARLALLAELVDKVLDRNSCLELDYMRGGLAGGYVKQVHELISKFENALEIRDGTLRVRVYKGAPSEEHRASWISESDLNDYLSCRQFFREIIAANAASCHVDVSLFQACARQPNNGFSTTRIDVATYENFRNHILHGRYEEAFGRDALQQLTVATQDDSLLAVDDVDAPLVTITKEDFSDLTKLTHVSREQALNISGAARSDMTIFEHELLTYMRERKSTAELLVVITNDFEKDLHYNTSESDGTYGKRTFLVVQSSYKAIKVIVAARAIDEEGRPIKLGYAQKLVEQFCRDRAYLKKGCLDSYDRHVFARSVLPEKAIEELRRSIESQLESSDNDVHISKIQAQLVLAAPNLAFNLFTPEIQERMRDPKLKWELMGKHGLKESARLGVI